MSERFRLVFRGEVLEGQHKAVVKQRLGAVLKLDGAKLDALFTGKAVTIRKDTDPDTAAKFRDRVQTRRRASTRRTGRVDRSTPARNCCPPRPTGHRRRQRRPAPKRCRFPARAGRRVAGGTSDRRAVRAGGRDGSLLPDAGGAGHCVGHAEPGDGVGA